MSEHSCKELHVSDVSSVPVESMFATRRLMLNIKRSLMTAYRANILTVIHEKYFHIIYRTAAISIQSVDSTGKMLSYLSSITA